MLVRIISSLKNIFTPLTNRKAILIIIVVGSLVFYNSLSNQFVLDDYSQIVDNSLVHSIKNIPSMFLGSSFGDGSQSNGLYYKPIMTSFFGLLYGLFEANPLPFHLFQVVVHISNSILLFCFFKLFYKRNISLVLALIFIVHPINSEAVFYISNLQDVFYIFFGLVALLVVRNEKLTIKSYILTGVFLLASLLSKETGVLFVLLVPIFRLFHLNRKLTLVKKEISKIIVVVALVIGGYVLLRILVAGLPPSADESFPIVRLSFLGRMSNVPAILYYYFSRVFFPKDIAVGQQWVINSIDFSNFYKPLLIVSMFFVGIVAFGIRIFISNKKYFKLILFFVFWFSIGVVMLVQIFPLDGTVADRWFLFPIVGLLGLVGVIVEFINYKKSVLFLLVVSIGLFACRTIIRSEDWKDNLTIVRHDTQVTDSFSLESNLGYQLSRLGYYDEALIHLEKSVNLNPHWWANWNNLGMLYRHKGYAENDPVYIDKARSSFDRAIENTFFQFPYENQAELLLGFKGPQEAKDFIDSISSKITLDYLLLRYLAITEYKLGNQERAVSAAKQSYLLNPNDTLGYELYQAILNNQKVNFTLPIY